MERRPLGRTGHQVSAVGFGTWGLGGDMWRGLDRDEARAALRAAISGGCNLVDTALVYGWGESEKLVGEVVRETGGALVATKVPPLDQRWPPSPDTPLEQIFPVDHLVRSVETSLRNLKVDALEVEQLHVWLDAWLDSAYWPELRGAMERLVREGKVRHWGISVNDHAPDTALRAVDEPLIETVQVIYNIFDRSAERALFARAAAAQVGIIVRCPFDEGALVGAIRADSSFDPADFRAHYFRGERKAEAAARADRLRPLLGAEASSLAELALRFCLSRPEVSTVIPGMRRRAHVESNLACADGRPLSRQLIDQLADHAWDKNWYAW